MKLAGIYYIVLAAALADLISIASIDYVNAQYRSEKSKSLTLVNSVVRVCLTLYVVYFCRDSKVTSMVVAIVNLTIFLSGLFCVLIPSLDLETTNWKGDHVAFTLSLVFALFEVMVIYLYLYDLGQAAALVRTTTTPNHDKDLEKPLLRGGEETFDENNPMSGVKTDFTIDLNQVDEYRGQGTTKARLASLAWNERHMLFVATVALFVGSAANIVTPALAGNLIQTISVSHDKDELNKTILLLGMLFTVSSFFSLIRMALFTLAGERVVARMRIRVFHAIMNQDVSFFDANQSGELNSRLTSDIAIIQNAVTVNVSMALRFMVSVLSSLIIIFFISWKLTLMMLSILPPIFLGARIYGTLIQKISKAYQESISKSSEVSVEAFSNLRTVRCFNQESKEVQKYSKQIFESYKYGKKRAWNYGFFLGFIGLIVYYAILFVLWYGGRMVIENKDGLSSADLTSFLLYTMNLAVSLGGLSELFSTLMSAMGASERIFTLLDLNPKVHNQLVLDSNYEDEKKTDNAIAFENVTFSYPSRPDVAVFKNLNFVVKQGSISAFVGHSGGGKSTIISMIERFYDPTSGNVYVNGRNVKSLTPKQLHSTLGIVSQEPTLFANTIYENICYGIHDRSVTVEEVEKAAEQANALAFIKSFPDGLNTLVGEKGVQLSGGQKQRVCIARAILMDPKILLLDEATSALDSESEHLVQAALDVLMKKRTTIVVAHRLSTIVVADEIFVLEKGEIIQRGTHVELLQETDGVYASLVKRQMARE